MKKLLLSILLLVMVLTISGCGKKEEETVITCTNTTEENGVTIKVTDVSKYDDNNMLTYSRIETLESNFANKDLYLERKNEYELIVKNVDSSVIYSVETDDNAMIIKVVLLIENFDLSTYTEIGKENLLAKNIIRNYELNGYSCTITGSTREKLELD